MTDDASSPQENREHRELRELLGSFALGHLDAAERDRLQAHLDGCANCRAELDELRSVREHLDLVDPSVIGASAAPSPQLGERIQDVLELEDRRAARDRRRRSASLVLGAAAAVIVIGAASFGLGRSTAPQPTPPPLESVALEATPGTPITIADAALVAHTWGVELRFAGAGFAEGEVFQAYFVDDEGERVAAGQFVGTGAAEMNCNLQSSPLREDVVAVLIENDSRTTVARAAL